MYFERAICFSTHQEDLSRNTTSVWLVHFDPKLQLRVYFCFFGLVHLDPTSQPSFVKRCFSFSLPVSRFWQRPESSLCTCLSRPRCKISAFKSKKLRPLDFLRVERQFCCKHGQCGKMSRSTGFLTGEKNS